MYVHRRVLFGVNVMCMFSWCECVRGPLLQWLQIVPLSRNAPAPRPVPTERVCRCSSFLHPFTAHLSTCFLQKLLDNHSYTFPESFSIISTRELSVRQRVHSGCLPSRTLLPRAHVPSLSLTLGRVYSVLFLNLEHYEHV